LVLVRETSTKSFTSEDILRCVPDGFLEALPKSKSNKEKSSARSCLLVTRLRVTDFLSTIVTGDETWIHHLEPEKKRHYVEWHHTTSPRK
jgi:hypothetical protein